MADQATRRDVTDRNIAITAEHIEAIKDRFILELRTHLDSLSRRLQEPRVQKILDPMLAGAFTPDLLEDDFAYLAGLGLIRFNGRSWQIANPIYREVIPRALTFGQQIQMTEATAWYLDSVGNLDMPKLMAGWQNFWRQDGHLAAEGFGYRESGPHLMLMAFLQRIINGGGQLEREYALGKRALDLLITWKQQKIPIEVKLRRDTETEADALTQVARYLDSLNTTEGWLVFFDLRAQTPWSDRLYIRTESYDGKTIHIVGC